MKCSFQDYGTEVIVGDTAVVSVMTEGENQEKKMSIANPREIWRKNGKIA